MIIEWPYVKRDTPPHPSHTMGEARTAVLCPASTPRFYSVRTCTACKARVLSGNGYFLHPALAKPCTGEPIEYDPDDDADE